MKTIKIENLEVEASKIRDIEEKESKKIKGGDGVELTTQSPGEEDYCENIGSWWCEIFARIN